MTATAILDLERAGFTREQVEAFEKAFALAVADLKSPTGAARRGDGGRP